MVRILEERAFPLDDLVLLASERSEGKRLPFRGEEVPVRPLSDAALAGVDLALVSAGKDVSLAVIPPAAAGGTVCVDNSSAFRMDPGVPLVIPEVNPEALEGSPRVVAVPNCTAIVTLMAVAPLHRTAGLRSLILSSYQSVSGQGMKGIRELAEQVEKMQGRVEELARPDRDALPAGEVFGRTIAFNVLARCDVFEGEWTREERKLIDEPRKILGLPGLEIAATAVRVPVAVGHAVSIHAAFARPIDPEEARAVLRDAPGVEVVDDPASGAYPTPVDSAGKDDVLVGRIRRPEGREDALLLFAAGDNLRKGAALNAVQIAERLFG